MNTTTMERQRFSQRNKNVQVEELSYCLYARKSSESEERQALSIDSQIKEMMQLADAEKLNIVETKRESHSAKDSGQREVFNEVLEGIEAGKWNALICWDPSRISRNGGDLGRVIDLMDRGELIEIQTHTQKFTNSPNDKFLMMILISQCKMENDTRGMNIKRGLRTKCEMGARPGAVPLGYKLIRCEELGVPSKIIIDEERAIYIKKMFKYVIDGCSGRQVNEYVTGEGFRTKKGKKITLSMTYRILKEPFYYGEFEYPKGSGDFYKGSYEPIINKIDFDKVQEKLKVPDKGKWGRKEFYFSRLFKCAHCGSGITGEEKINRFGTRYVYYRCNKYGRGRTCKSKYAREANLVKAVAKVVDQMKTARFRLNTKINREVEKINSMQKITNGENAKEITSRDYIEFILREGTKPEKRDLLKCVDGQLLLKDGEVFVGQ